MALEVGKSICDPIHGSIRLTKVEREIVDCGAFQRLRGISHLGLASQVFPGAAFTRFGHSLGACHIAGRILTALEARGHGVGAAEQTVRLAALLHDAGHYPFSHAMEHAVRDFFSGTLLDPGAEPVSGFRHEELSKELILGDPQLTGILKRHGQDPEAIARFITREEPSTGIANVVSSDLDADRIDYLIRMAHHAGLPYGALDLEYLLSQISRDVDGRICLTEKALRAADHLLISRVFAYQQVPYHKTVVALESMLEHVLKDLLDDKLLDCSRSVIAKRISEGSWAEFDDAYVLGQIRLARASADKGSSKWLRADAVLSRKPPKLLAEKESWGERTKTASDLAKDERIVQDQLPKWVAKFGIEADRWIVWTKNQVATKTSPVIPVGEEVEEDAILQGVLIQRAGEAKAQQLHAMRQSLMGVLGSGRWTALRVYVVLPDHERERADEIRKEVLASTKQVGW